MTPAFGSSRVSKFENAPRALNDPRMLEVFELEVG